MSGHCERVGAWTLGLSALGLALACQAKAPESAVQQAPKSSPAGGSPRAAESAPPEKAISLSVAKAPSFRPATGLLDLQDGRQFSRAEFEAVPLRPLSPEAVQATERGGLLLSLDEQSPRPLLA